MRETAGKAGAAIGTALGYAMLLGREWDSYSHRIELGIGPRYYKQYDQNVLGVSAMMHYQHQIYRNRLGIIGGIGCSLGTKSPKGYKKDALGVGFEWNIGLVTRLFSR